jgi:hypothetical protein
VKNHEEIERPFSKPQKSLKYSLLEELESSLAAWFKEACVGNTTKIQR